MQPPTIEERRSTPRPRLKMTDLTRSGAVSVVDAAVPFSSSSSRIPGVHYSRTVRMVGKNPRLVPPCNRCHPPFCIHQYLIRLDSTPSRLGSKERHCRQDSRLETRKRNTRPLELAGSSWDSQPDNNHSPLPASSNERNRVGSRLGLNPAGQVVWPTAQVGGGALVALVAQCKLRSGTSRYYSRPHCLLPGTCPSCTSSCRLRLLALALLAGLALGTRRLALAATCDRIVWLGKIEDAE